MRMKMSILAALFVLSGCAVLPNSFDNVEHGMLADVYALSNNAVAQCENPAEIKQVLKAMKHDTTKLFAYTLYKSGEGEAHKMVIELDGIVNEMQTRYNKETPTSKSYCELKFYNIRSAAERIMTAIGKEKK